MCLKKHDNTQSAENECCIVIDAHLTPNEYSRPCKPLKETLAIVMHWTANPNASAKNNRDFFEAKKTGMGGYASAHYIIDQDGSILQCIPDNEVAYHCGTSSPDPVSKMVYTDYARKKFKSYCIDFTRNSPNNCTIGIELCPTDWDGHFSDETIKSAVLLCTELCTKHKLTADDITTHHDIVGWKDCPKLWTENPELFEEFKNTVKEKLKNVGNN